MKGGIIDRRWEDMPIYYQCGLSRVYSAPSFTIPDLYSSIIIVRSRSVGAVKRARGDDKRALLSMSKACDGVQ